MRQKKLVSWFGAGLAGVCCVYAMTSCVRPWTRAPKVDTVSAATAAYVAGDRGAPPHEGEGYEVLGVKDGIKAWVIRYDSRLLRGGEFHNESAAKVLKGWNVKTIVSISPNDKERDFCKRHGFELVEIPFDKGKGPASADIKKFLETMATATSPVYLHCIGGVHRGGVMGVAYRVHLLKWPYEKALLEFGRLGGHLKDDHVMLEAVRNYKP